MGYECWSTQERQNTTLLSSCIHRAHRHTLLVVILQVLSPQIMGHPQLWWVQLMQKPYAYSYQASHLPAAVLVCSTVTQHDKTWEQPKASQLNNYQQDIQPAAQSTVTQTPLSGNIWQRGLRLFSPHLGPGYSSLDDYWNLMALTAGWQEKKYSYHFPLLSDPIYILWSERRWKTCNTIKSWFTQL